MRGKDAEIFMLEAVLHIYRPVIFLSVICENARLISRGLWTNECFWWAISTIIRVFNIILRPFWPSAETELGLKQNFSDSITHHLNMSKNRVRTAPEHLRHCAMNRKVAGSNPDIVIGIFHWRNPYGHTMALGLTQPLTEMSTRNISCGGKGSWCIGLTTLPPSCADCLEIWEPWPPGTLRACPGL